MRKSRNLEKRRHGLQMVTLCISTTMVLTLLGLVMLSVLTAHNLQKNLRENVEISVILGDTIAKEDGVALGKMIQKKPYAHQVAFISSEEALKMAKEEMGIDPTEFTGSNPFSPELTVTMEAEYANTDSLSVIVKRLLKDRRVVDVAYTKDEIDGMNRILEPVSIALLGLSVLLIFICYTLISNSIQLSIYSRRFLIHTMKLVGASWGFIRRPFLKKAVVVGVISALLTCALLGGIIYMLMPFMPHVEEIMTWRELAITAAAVFVFGFVITVFCTLLSVNKFLRMTAGELYKI
ncbi:permease-like cell division protein FtsX [uncultured Prevotella sp.]|jgi:cell division transport system permease protein|uniref:cell division protein FtsX n=1 Tax=uncultured Prevotella sp. TaxID=159272 RepID=UPI0025858B7E|nr:permease-like cell division protein FtsX [uncultured Prevotella sp.]